MRLHPTFLSLLPRGLSCLPPGEASLKSRVALGQPPETASQADDWFMHWSDEKSER